MMGSISPYWILLLQVFLVVHVLATDRSRYWILLLLFVPLIGGLAYLVLEILPQLGGGIGGQKAKRSLGRVINPGGQLKKMAIAWERTPNADNGRHYAAALLEAGRLDEAERVIDQALSGLFRTEPNLLLIKARLKFEQENPQAAVELLELLQRENPGFRSAEGHLLLARALEQAGQTARALEAYRDVAGYFPGVEARYRLGQALAAAGREDESRQEFEKILQDARLAPAHFRRAQSHWLRKCRAALK
jgi:hypothetical protein